MIEIVLPALWETIWLVAIVVIIGTIFGVVLALILYSASPKGISPNRTIYRLANTFVNIVRSIPVLLLIVALFPITRAIVGTTLGTKAVVFPLSLAATAFISRYLENVFHNVSPSTIEAARSYGANNFDIIKNIILIESVPGIISVITIATINNIAASTVAGTVGGGGIGAVAITYGYQSFNDAILYTCVIILYILVQIVQTIGNKFYNKKLESR